MLLYPAAADVVKFLQKLRSETLRVETLFKMPKELEEVPVCLGILVLERAFMNIHAPLFLGEMHGDVPFQEPDQFLAKLSFLRARIPLMGHDLQPVDVTDQHLVLGIEHRVPDLEFITPGQHAFWVAENWPVITPTI